MTKTGSGKPANEGNRSASGAREIVLDVLLEILEKKQYSHLVLQRALAKYQYLDKQERSFIKRTVDGTLERLMQVDCLIESYSSVKLRKMKPVIRTILRMSVYQICFMDRIPDSAACNEAVKLAVRRGFSGLKGFVNGVLRNVSRHKDEITWPDDSTAFCLPQWIFSMWERQYGKEAAKTMAESFLKERPLTVRMNLSLASREEIFDSLESQGVKIRESGGKSLHIAELLHGTGMVEVRDLTEKKIALVEDNIWRSGFSNIEARVQDATEFDPDSQEKADLLIADLPCSGLGIIGRKPDIRYNVTEEQTRELAKLQREILSVVWRYVKPGGTMVFSTCTVDPAENEENVRWILSQLPFEPVDLTDRIGDALAETLLEDTRKKGYVQLLPGFYPGDGFFISVFRRKEE